MALYTYMGPDISTFKESYPLKYAVYVSWRILPLTHAMELLCLALADRAFWVLESMIVRLMGTVFVAPCGNYSISDVHSWTGTEP